MRGSRPSPPLPAPRSQPRAEGRTRPSLRCATSPRTPPRLRSRLPTSASEKKDAQPVPDQNLASERAEQDDALHHAYEAGWEVDALEGEARVLEAAEQHRDEADRQRVVPGQRRDDDARVAERGPLQPG